MLDIKNFLFLLTFIFGVGLLVGALFFYYQPSSDSSATINYSEENSIVTIDEQPIVVTVANTPELRERGLSGTANLPKGEGMLFVFPYSSAWGIWMKDMNYALDILWIDQSGSIIYMEENVTPESYPEVYRPDKSALYVLEVPAGFIASNNITLTSSVDLPESL